MKQVRAQSIAIASGEKTSAAVQIGQYDSALFHLPASFEATDMAFVGCTNRTGTYVSVTDGNGSAITQTVAASKWHTLDSGLFGLEYIKFVGDSAVATARTITVSGHATH